MAPSSSAPLHPGSQVNLVVGRAAEKESTNALSRQLRRHSKSRTGCVTCKQRRIKCDEAKPACRRCIESNLTCKGYQPPRTWLFDPKPRASERPGYSPPEVRALQFFTEKTDPQLRLFNSAADHFFHTVVLQIAEKEAAVRHMVIAVSAAQELTHDDVPNCTQELSVVHHQSYRSALQFLSDQASRPSIEAVLTACLLFIAAETILPQDPGKLFIHLHSGLKLLREWKRTSPRHSSDSVIEQFIEPIFAQLEASATYVKGSPITSHLTDLASSPMVLPQEFSGMLEAREKFRQLGMFTYDQYQKFPDLYMSGKLPQIWNAWKEYYTVLTRTRQNIPPTAKRKLWEGRALDAAWRGNMITLRGEIEPDEGIWDEYFEECRQLVDDIENLLYDPEAFQNVKTKDSVFLEIVPGFMPMIWMMGSACRDPKVRQKAIDLAQLQHDRCGHDSECSAVLQLQYIRDTELIGVENATTCADIPLKNRIRALGVDLTTSGIMVMSFLRWDRDLENAYTITVPNPRLEYPPVRKYKLWPLAEGQRLYGFQGLLQKEYSVCICKRYSVF